VGRKLTENKVCSEYTLLCQAHVTSSQECWQCSSHSMEIHKQTKNPT